MPTIESMSSVQGETEPEISISHVLSILRRRRQVLLIVVLAFTVLGCLYSLRARKFEASGVIRIQPGSASMYRTNPLSMAYGEAADQLASEVAIMQSRTLYLQVAKELDLANDPAFWGEAGAKHNSLDDPKVSELIIKAMRAKIQIAHSPKDEMITITATTTSPLLSTKIVNSLINDYVEYLFRMRYGASQRASGWLLTQLDDLKKQIEQDQTSITELQSKLGVIGFDTKDSEYLSAQSLNSMTKAANDATVDRIVAEAKFRFLQDSDPNLVEGEVNLLNSNASSPNGLLQNLRSTQAQLATSYSKLVAQFGPNYPEVKQQKAQLEEINKQVAAEEKRILNQAKLSYSAASANEKMTKDALSQQRGEAFSSRSDMVKYVILMHDYEAHRTLYEALVLRLREAGITSGLEGGEIDIVDLAVLPAFPKPPGPVTIIAGAALLGLFLGCILALASETLDTRVKSLDQAERASKLSVLAEVPHIKDPKKSKAAVGPSPIMAIAAPRSRYSEAIQNLRTSILLARPGSPPRIILVTSAIPREGKSTTSINLAATLKQHAARVLLIDCDLRRGELAYRLNLNPKVGLTNVLTGQVSLAEAIQELPDSNGLRVLVSGTRPPDPAVLMDSEEMHQLVRRCAEEYDFVILDSTPLLGLSDSLNLGRIADGVLQVIRSGLTTKHAVQRTSSQLSSANLPLLGFVFNDVSVETQGYGYGDYYGYYDESAGGKG